MDKKYMKRGIACCLAGVLMMACLSGCGNNAEKAPNETDGEVASEVVAAQDAAKKERDEYEDSIRKMNVLENAGEMKKVQDIVSEYYDVSTEMLSDMIAYQSEGVEGGLPTYIFIGKLTEDADSAQVSDELLDVALSKPGMDEDGAEIQVSTTNGMIIMAAAANGGDIVTKFSQVMSAEDSGEKTIQDVYNALSMDLTQA